MDAAALAERALGVGQEADNFAFVHVGSGIGMGLVLGGRLHRGVHGVAGEIAFMPLGGDPRAWDAEASAGSSAGGGRTPAGRVLAGDAGDRRP